MVPFVDFVFFTTPRPSPFDRPHVMILVVLALLRDVEPVNGFSWAPPFRRLPFRRLWLVSIYTRLGESPSGGLGIEV
jgi:hypothetical protein